MPDRYTHVAIALHWIIAALIICMLGLGFLMEDFPQEMKGAAYGLHKSTGLLILVLTLFRIVWRLMHKAPPLPADTKPAEALVAHGIVFGFYALMLALPMSGWALSSANPKGFPISFYGLFEWPFLPVLSTLDIEAKKEIAHSIGEAHEVMAIIMIGLLVLHVAAALKHHFVLKDGVLTRMLPFLKPLK